MKRSKFLSRINDMSQKQLNAANITIDNDEQVSKIIFLTMEKFFKLKVFYLISVLSEVV